MKKLLVIVVSLIAALAVFAGLGTFVLAINDWGRSTPPEAAQILWAINLVAYPFITYIGVSILLNKWIVR